MLKRLFQLFIIMILAAGCAQTTYTQGERSVRFGKITGLEEVTLEGRELGLGTIVGGIAGGYGANNIGKGKGQDVATIAGAIAGAVAGNMIENRLTQKNGQLVTVHLNDGSTVEITQPTNLNLSIGASVRVVGSGRNTRVVLN